MNTCVISQRVLILPKLALVNIRVLWVFLLISVFALLVFYIFQVSLMTRETYLIRESQERVRNLSRENNKLEISFSQESSLSSIEALVGSLGLDYEKANSVRYIQILEGQVVTR